MLIDDKIKLRYFELDDITKLSTIRSLPENYKFFYEFEPLNKEQQLSWWQNSYNKQNEKNFIIVKQESEELIGTVSLVNIDTRNRNAELGRLFVFNEFSGKGYAKLAVKQIINYAFKHLNLQKVFLEVISNNDNAIKLYEKIGFKEEGCLKSHIFKNGQYIDIMMMALFKNNYKF